MLKRTLSIGLVALTSFVISGVAGCGGSSEPSTQPIVDKAAEDARAAELAAKEQELSQREAALALKEKEDDLARREAELAAQQAEATKRASAQKRAARARPAASSSNSNAGNTSSLSRAPSEPVMPVATRLTVPTGTQLTVALTSDLSSKTARSGDPFTARLVSDLLVGGKLAVPAGARVAGTITDVVSGSSSIGGLPTLGLRFDRLELDDGQKIAINGELVEQGKSDTARDTAKILGGAAAGAVLGHQVKKNDRGKVIGGILGGAIGAVAAKKTGTEVELLDGSTLTISLGAPFEVSAR